jgi:hypothetical protein
MSDPLNDVLRQTMTRITSALADFLPGLLAFFVILLVTVGVAFALRTVVRRSLQRIEFDSRVGHWGFSVVNEWSPGRSPTMLMAQIAFFSVLLIGVLIGISALDTRLTSQLIVELFSYLPHVVAAIVILLVGSIASRFLARSVLIGAVNMQIHSARLLSAGVKWLVIVLSVAIALDHLRIGGLVVQISFAILFGGIVLALALAVGLGSKDMVRQSWERQTDRTDRMDREAEEQLHHL